MPIIEVSPFIDTFSDETKSNVGSSYFSLSNDWFVGSELVIRTGAAGAGVLLILGTDYELSEFNSFYSVKIESNVYHQIRITNPAYQSTTLYFSGKSVKTKIDVPVAGPLGDDEVKDNMIDWGSATGQVGAVDMPIVDSGSRITATEVENALQELAGSGRTTETIKDNAADLSTHTGLDTAGVHGSTTAATADRLVHRDASGRAQIVGPSVAADIVNKSYADSTYLGITAKAADSSLLNNAVESVSAGNDTIVKRHSSGYIYANYFNTTPNTVTSGVTQVCVETGDDGFIRHGTQAAIRIFIGAGAGNGLNADLLDGSHAAAFELAFSKNSAFNKDFAGTGSVTTVSKSDHNHDTTYLKLTGGTLTNSLSISAGGLTLLGGNTMGKFTVSTSAPSGGADNDIWLVRDA